MSGGDALRTAAPPRTEFIPKRIRATEPQAGDGENLNLAALRHYPFQIPMPVSLRIRRSQIISKHS